MAVKIRLRRSGKVNEPSHRIVVTDVRSPRDGRFIEIIGMYDPRHKTERLDLERADYWLARGAQASETVAAIIKRTRAGVALDARPSVAKAASKPAAAAEAPVAAPAPADA